MAISQEERNIFARNLQRYMDIANKTQKDISETAGVSQATVSEWLNCRKYPRMDKIQKLADYFGIKKSDLIEDKFKGSTENAIKDALRVNRVQGNEELKECIDIFFDLNEEQQDAILRIIRSYKL